MERVEPDYGLLLAWQRATTGANDHEFSRIVWYYKHLCEKGDAEKAEMTASTMRRRLISLQGLKIS